MSDVAWEKEAYYVSLSGNCTIVMASSLEVAEEWALREFGRFMEPHVRPAEPDEVGWTKGMGGRIHEAD